MKLYLMILYIVIFLHETTDFYTIAIYELPDKLTAVIFLSTVSFTKLSHRYQIISFSMKHNRHVKKRRLSEKIAIANDWCHHVKYEKWNFMSYTFLDIRHWKYFIATYCDERYTLKASSSLDGCLQIFSLLFHMSISE